ncbi:MAG: WG repeat-containing protein, partial [Planctomycetes bacterium]|nr:WG repeat-containing protein [Planctomycetota bacterium]
PERVFAYLDRRFEFVLRITPEMPGGRYFLMGKEFHDGMAAVAIGHSGEERKAFISRDGELVFEGKFLQVQPFSEGLAAVSLVCLPKHPSGNSQRWGFVNKAGNMVIQPQFLWTAGLNEGKAAVIVELEGDSATSPRGQWGFIDKQGKLIIKPRFYKATNFYNGLARVQDNPYSHGYINESGEYVWRLDEPSYRQDAPRE